MPVTDQDKKAKQRAARRITAYKEVFESDAGKKVLYSLMKHACIFQTEFNNKVDANHLIFKEGQRDIINYILYQLKFDPEQIHKFFEQREQLEIDDDAF